MKSYQWVTVQSIISKYRKTGKLENLTGPGRKTIFNNRQERQILKKIRNDTTISAPNIKAGVENELGIIARIKETRK